MAVALLSALLLASASAQGRGPVASGNAQITFATTTVPRTTTTRAATTTTSPATTTTSTPPTTQPRATTTTQAPATVATTAAPDTTTVPPPTTTVASIPAPAPPPVTLPLGSASQSGSIGAIFPILGGIGLFSLVTLLVAQWFLTKPGRRGPTL
jgi:hypothetical protein